MLAELMLSYQKRAHELRINQEPLRRRIRNHNKAMQEAVAKIQASGEGQLAELEGQLHGYTQQLDTLRDSMNRVELELFGEDFDPKAPRPTEEDQDEAKDDGLGESDGKKKEEATPEELAYVSRDVLEEVQGHRTNLLTDMEVIKRTLGMLDSKLRTSPTDGGAAKKRK